MTPEQLEAHRVRFEQVYDEKKRSWRAPARDFRSGVHYEHSLIEIAWQAYQWALADADRAQRAAPVSESGAQQNAQPVGKTSTGRKLANLKILGGVYAENIDSQALKLLESMVGSIEIVCGEACWNHIAMFDLRDEIEHLLDAATPPPVEVQPIAETPGSNFIQKTNKECKEWMHIYYTPDAIERNFLISLWAWQQQERRYAALLSSTNVTLKERIKDLVVKHGGLRKAAMALGTTAPYLVRLRTGTALDPGPQLLAAMGLQKIVTYASLGTPT